MNWLLQRLEAAGAHLRETVTNLFRKKARPYRFAGEQENHAQQLAETQAAIAGFAAVEADPDATPEQRHWLHAHRVGMEERLVVFEGKPRLTVEELHERDAIETHLYGAPLQRGKPAGWEPRPQARASGFLGSLAAVGGVRLWMILGAGWAVTGGALAIQSALKERIEDQRDDARRVAEENAAAADRWEERAHAYEQATADATQAARVSAAALEAERERAARAAARERRRQREVQSVLTGGDPPAWRLRDDAPQPGGAPGADGAATGDPG